MPAEGLARARNWPWAVSTETISVDRRKVIMQIFTCPEFVGANQCVEYCHYGYYGNRPTNLEDPEQLTTIAQCQADLKK